MVEKISVKGDKINGQIVRYQIAADREISKYEIHMMEKMKKSEFLAYVNENNIRYHIIGE